MKSLRVIYMLMKRLSYIFSVIIIFYMPNEILCEVPSWDVDNIHQEMNQLPLKTFAKNNIWQHYKDVVLPSNNANNLILIEINNNTIFINETEITQEQVNLLSQKSFKTVVDGLTITMFVLAQNRQLPDVTFLYSKATKKHFKSIANKIKNVPILVGNKDKLYNNTISFIESCSFSRGVLAPEYAWETVFQKTLSFLGKYPWQIKKNVVFWRGDMSDPITMVDSDIMENLMSKVPPKMRKLPPRFILHVLSLKYPSYIDAKITACYYLKLKYFFKMLYQQDDIPIATRVDMEDHLKYKYQVVIDGLYCTNPGFAWRLLSDCCVFKVDSPLYQWFYIGLQPWVHFIPIKSDLSDLMEKTLWAQQHDKEAEKIALSGQEFALNYLRPDHYFEHALMVLTLYQEQQIQADLLEGL
jgi:hypothetical protein